jgi:predicted N-acetyltransferase YhbS
MTIIPYSSKWDPDIAALLDASMGPGRYARTAERLREGNQQIDAYCFLMLTEDSALRASISFWPLRIGSTFALLLGPLAVRPIDQGKGYGQSLMGHALNVIDADADYPIILVGDLPYYQRAGFQVASADIRLPGPVDPKRLLLRGSASERQPLAGLVRPAPMPAL